MAKRSYKQNCALAHAADVIGERWSLLLIRELMLGPRRYGELNKALKGIGTNLLVSRLRELESAGILKKVAFGRSHSYELTESGRALEPAVLALIRWGMRHAERGQAGYLHRPEWDLVALKATFDARNAPADTSVEFAAEGWNGWAEVRQTRLEIGLGKARAPDVVVYGNVQDLFRPTGTVKPRLSGNVEKLQRFMAAFSDAGLSPNPS